jgi:transcriptional regulator with XRE-family HTH domain
MIPFMDGKRRAARAVAARRGELGLTQQELAGAAGVDSKTIYNLESRGRWPIARTRASIEKALDWPVGEMERIADSEPDPLLDPQDEHEEAILSSPRLTRDDKRQMIASYRRARASGAAPFPSGPGGGGARQGERPESAAS